MGSGRTGPSARKSFPLHKVQDSLIGRGSFVQRVQHSKALQAVFNDHAKNANTQHVDSTRVKELVIQGL